ncbi:phage holin family protein [Halomonas sp. RA08-2]|uniref:phage holin family protein n=1 Tax=Halomonas sp. RA08-2 TaxID=3440842 RepID=UPI003F492026
MSVFTDIAILAAVISVFRILTFQRRGSRYRRGIALLAWLVSCVHVTVIVKLPTLDLPEPAAAGLALVLVTIAALLLRAGGNLAHLFRWRH